MPRRFIPMLIGLVTLAALSVHASDFWLSKDWKQWSKHECGAMLRDSPWAHTWKGGRTRAIDATPDSSPAGVIGTEDQLEYIVQIRSALPVREALIRQQQLDQNYEKMSAEQRTAFDTQATKILDRNFDDAILVHVDFSGADLGPLFGNPPRAIIKMSPNVVVSLVADDGSKILATRVDVNQINATFDAIFPRLVDSVPVIKDRQKHFAIQFQSPGVSVSKLVGVAGQAVKVEFDLGKMLVGGKPSY